MGKKKKFEPEVDAVITITVRSNRDGTLYSVMSEENFGPVHAVMRDLMMNVAAPDEKRGSVWWDHQFGWGRE